MKKKRKYVSGNLSYTLRISGRAKRVWLKMRPEGLEIVIPKGFDIGLIDEIIHRKKAWIHKAFKERNAMLAQEDAAPFPPDKIELNAVGRVISIGYRSGPDPEWVLEELPEDRIQIIGPVDQAEMVGTLLTDWLRTAGRRHLKPWLESVADRTGFSYKRVQVRCQKSRWGSCSTRGTISLNAKLLFLPPQHVEYVLVHELCHTVHPNHSPDFWRLVDRFSSTRASSEAFLKHAGSCIPPWADGRFGGRP